ncbi:MAG: hypothetical protein AAF682_00220 [Planctomycetota bacterium]
MARRAAQAGCGGSRVEGLARPRPEYWSTQLPLSGDEPTLVVQAPHSKRMLGEVTFPGRRMVPLDFRTPESGGEVVIPIELVRAEEAATLSFELQDPLAEAPETFTVTLRREDQDYPPDVRWAHVAEGRLRVEDIVPGKYRVSVCACDDPNHPGLFFKNEFELDLLPGLVTRRTIKLKAGAGLRVTVRDENGELLGGQYEFYDDQGSRVRLVLVVHGRGEAGRDRWASTSTLYPYGTHESGDPLDAGRYRLVLISPGYENQSVTFDLREGDYEEVDVTLSK